MNLFFENMNEEYYYYIINLLSKLLKDFNNTPNDDFIRAAQSINICSLYSYLSNSRINLYRARYSERFDDKDPTQFSYIHAVDKIKQLRFNKGHEPVFYSATHPTIAYKEIEQPGNSGPFFLSVWRPTKVLNCVALYNPDYCTSDSTAEKYSNILSEKIKKSQVGKKYLGLIGELMEHEGTNYSFSSELAYRIFKNIDALLSVSAKSKRSELNITLRQTAADTALKMQYVLLCDKCDGLLFTVQKIGLLEGNSIVWYKLKLDETSYKRESEANEKTDDLWAYTKENPLKINPVSIDSIEDNMVHMLIGGKESPVYSYKFKLCKL